MMLLSLKPHSTPFTRDHLTWNLGVQSHVNLRVSESVLSSNASNYIFVHLDHIDSSDTIIGIRFMCVYNLLVKLPRTREVSSCSLSAVTL
jgi:hypothetical protein